MILAVVAGPQSERNDLVVGTKREPVACHVQVTCVFLQGYLCTNRTVGSRLIDQDRAL